MQVVGLSGVGVRRGDAMLLEDVTWSVDEGDRWVVVGPNGAGKTTLLSLLSAQIHPTLGTVDLLGERLGRVDVFELRTRIGVASSQIARRIPGTERVSDVVISAAYSVMGRWREEYTDADHARADTLMSGLHVSHLARRTFGTLSDGERKRVEIARALMTDPELLLLDEPGAGLDLSGRESLVASLAALCADPLAPATVLVTHHLEEIPPGITHALLLGKAHVVASGPIDDVLNSEALSATYGMSLTLVHEDERWSARADGDLAKFKW
jgi:iron complex transport system ATP-binding protein